MSSRVSSWGEGEKGEMQQGEREDVSRRISPIDVGIGHSFVIKLHVELACYEMLGS